MDKKQIKICFKNKASNLKKYLKETRQAIRQIEKGEWIFRVKLISLWADCGETTVTYDGEFEEPLEKVISGANEQFKKINNRGDVQASKIVFVVAKNGENILIEC